LPAIRADDALRFRGSGLEAGQLGALFGEFRPQPLV
jgi:hypothetical protein